jgi:hypothetical protein
LIREPIPAIRKHETIVLLHNDAVAQGLSEAPFRRDVEHWEVLTIGTGFGNASFRNKKQWHVRLAPEMSQRRARAVLHPARDAGGAEVAGKEAAGIPALCRVERRLFPCDTRQTTSRRLRCRVEPLLQYSLCIWSRSAMTAPQQIELPNTGTR